MGISPRNAPVGKFPLKEREFRSPPEFFRLSIVCNKEHAFSSHRSTLNARTLSFLKLQNHRLRSLGDQSRCFTRCRRLAGLRSKMTGDQRSPRRPNWPERDISVKTDRQSGEPCCFEKWGKVVHRLSTGWTDL